MAGRKILIAVDESQTSRRALGWALSHIFLPNDEVHLITVLPPIAYGVYPVAPVATAAGVAAVSRQWEAQKKHDEDVAKDTLKAAVKLACSKYKLPRTAVHTHGLPAAGGASGVAESLVEYANSRGADVLVVGSRGMGSLKRSLMSLVGLGSVSDYCLHHSNCPVLVVRSDDKELCEEQPIIQRRPKRVCIGVDDSPHSEAALQWTLDNVLKPDDTLHLLTVALPVPYPILDDSSAAVAAAETQQWQSQSEHSLRIAQNLCSKVADAVVAKGVDRARIVSQVLVPEGGASGVGTSLCHYASDNQVDVVIVGSRNMGTISRSIMSFIGLGSVSDYCVHNLHSAVIVMKGEILGHSNSAQAGSIPIN